MLKKIIALTVLIFVISCNDVIQPIFKEKLVYVVPDLFKEGSGVVVLGYLKDKTLIAEDVLAKHDENYMPPSIDLKN